jgi:hypothetical protein
MGGSGVILRPLENFGLPQARDRVTPKIFAKIEWKDTSKNPTEKGRGKIVSV